MTEHPSNMALWPEIACQRGHDTHSTRQVHVKLGGLTPYFDLAPIPSRFAREFEMLIWNPAVHPVDGLAYCPAADAVSETIASHGVWEPQETILTLQVCSSAEPDQVMVDFGAQIGWFSVLALSCGASVLALEADEENLRILHDSIIANGWYTNPSGFWSPDDRWELRNLRVGPETPPFEPRPIRLAKIDIEGAEDQAIRVLWPSIEAGLVDHLLIEVSPVFADYYPDLVDDLLRAGYTAYLLPEKSMPPARLSVFPDDLEAGRIDPLTARETVAGISQANCWFVRDGASW